MQNVNKIASTTISNTANSNKNTKNNKILLEKEKHLR